MYDNILDLEVLTGANIGDRVLLPRIDLSPSDTTMPFFKRRQFPIRLAFCITINKAQGQTLDRVGIYLPDPVFSHGQLYVALSRGRTFRNVKGTIERRQKHIIGTEADLNINKNTTFKKISPLLKNQADNVPSLLNSVATKLKVWKASTLTLNSSGDNFQHHARLGEYAAQLYKDRCMTDVLVVVQSREFKAHKAVLACYSPYFDEVLNKPGFNEVHYLQIPSVTDKAFEILLDYMYSGELRVTCQELSEVYRAAKRLGVRGALSKCVELLQVTQEQFQNMVYLYVTARKLDLLDASTRGFKLMVLNFEKLITTKEFLDLEIEQVIELFSTDEIGARSEVMIFMAALKWLDYDYLEREEHLDEIFDCVRFPLMSQEEVVACYHPPLLPGIMVRPKIREALLNATCYITAKSLGQENLFAELACKSRTFLFGGEPMVLWDFSLFDPERYGEARRVKAATKIQSCFRGFRTRKRLQEQTFITNYAATVIQSVYRGYRVRKRIQMTKSAMKKKGRSSKNYFLSVDRKSGFLKAYVKRTFETLDQDTVSERHSVIYAMGAFDVEEEETNSLFAFDIQGKTWKILDNCLVPRHDARMVYFDGHLYIIGGFDPTHRTEDGRMLPLKQCHRYHVESGEWRKLADMEEARCCHAAAIFNEQVLVVGGKDETNRVLSSIERYDFSVGKWKTLSPCLPEPRMSMGCTYHEGKLWIAGGITSYQENIYVMDSVWNLDHKTCRWTKKASLPIAVAFPTLVSDGNNLFCIGGAIKVTNNQRDELESTDKIYKFEKGAWVEHASMLHPSHSIVGCSIGQTLYLLGGFNSHTMSHFETPFSMQLDDDKKHENLEFLPLPYKAAGFIAEVTSAELKDK